MIILKEIASAIAKLSKTDLSLLVHGLKNLMLTCRTNNLKKMPLSGKLDKFASRAITDF